MKSAERKVFIGFLTISLILTTITGITYRNMNSWVERGQINSHSLEILKLVEELYKNVIDIETGSRGYLISADTTFLKPYHTGLKEVYKHLDILKFKSREDTSHYHQILGLEKQTLRLISLNTAMVTSEQLGKTDSLLRHERIIQSKSSMDSVRYFINNIEKIERNVLKTRNQENIQKALVTKYGYLSITFISIIILLVVFILIWRESKRRRDAEAKMLETKDILESIIYNSPNIIFLRNMEGKYLLLNNSYERITGIHSNNLVGKFDHEIALEYKYPLMGMEEEKVILDKKEIIKNDHTFFNAKGELIHLFNIRFPLFSPNGKLNMICGLSVDITKRVIAEERIKKLNEELNYNNTLLTELNNDLESFSYSISHDLRAPLRAIDGFGKIMMEDYHSSLDDEGIRILSVVINNAQRMGALIDGLLNFSKLGRQNIHLSEIKTKEVISEVLNEIEIPSKINISINDLHHCKADRILLKQVWSNLISNALKYSGKSDSPKINISSTKNDTEVIYMIEDNGVGFDMKYADKLFDVFQRLHSNEEFEGTGVGLAVVQRIVSKHGGRVWAESLEDENTKFYFSIPDKMKFHFN